VVKKMTNGYYDPVVPVTNEINWKDLLLGITVGAIATLILKRDKEGATIVQMMEED